MNLRLGLALVGALTVGQEALAQAAPGRRAPDPQTVVNRLVQEREETDRSIGKFRGSEIEMCIACQRDCTLRVLQHLISLKKDPAYGPLIATSCGKGIDATCMENILADIADPEILIPLFRQRNACFSRVLRCLMQQSGVSLLSKSSEIEIEIANGVTLVLFYRNNNPDSRALLPFMAKMAKKYAGQLKVAAAETSQKRMRSEYGITETPTFMIFQNGEEVGDVLSGPFEEAEIETHIRDTLRELRGDEKVPTKPPSPPQPATRPSIPTIVTDPEQPTLDI